MTTLKAVIMDLDGSTLAQDNIMPENLKNFIQENSFLDWVVATSRGLGNARTTPVIQCLSNYAIPHIFEGGARIANLNGKLFEESLLAWKEIENFFEQINLDELHYIYYATDSHGGNLWTKELEVWHSRLEIVNSTDDIFEFKDWINNSLPAKLAIQAKENTTLANNYKLQLGNYLDITANGVNKGSAYVKLLKYLNLQPSETLFIFNDVNDLPVIHNPQLKEISTLKVGDFLPNIPANYTAASPFEVADVLRKIIYN